MMRSYLLSIWLKSMSLVDWAERLRSDESLAILSGFPPDHTPSFGAFYDFFHRLWPGCNNFLPHLRYRRKNPPKGKGNGEKSPSFDKDHADTIIKYFKKHSAGGILKSKLYIIGEIYSKVFMTGSMHKNLLDVRKLVLAGDGTPVKVSNRERSHSMCDCHEKGIGQRAPSLIHDVVYSIIRHTVRHSHRCLA